MTASAVPGVAPVADASRYPVMMRERVEMAGRTTEAGRVRAEPDGSVAPGAPAVDPRVLGGETTPLVRLDATGRQVALNRPGPASGTLPA